MPNDINQQIIDLYMNMVGRAPNADVLNYFVNDIGSGKSTLNDLSNTLTAFQNANSPNSYLNTAVTGFNNAIQQPAGSTISRGTVGDPMRTAVVGSGDHAGQLGYTRYDGSTAWSNDPTSTHTDEHTIFDANGNGVAYGYTDPTTGQMVATTPYRTGTPDSPYIISNNTSTTAQDGTTQYFHPGGQMYGTKSPDGFTTYTPESGLSSLNNQQLYNTKTGSYGYTPGHDPASVYFSQNPQFLPQQQTPQQPQQQPTQAQNQPPQWATQLQSAFNQFQQSFQNANNGSLGGLGGVSQNQGWGTQGNSPVYRPNQQNQSSGFGSGWGNNPFHPTF